MLILLVFISQAVGCKKIIKTAAKNHDSSTESENALSRMKERLRLINILSGTWKAEFSSGTGSQINSLNTLELKQDWTFVEIQDVVFQLQEPETSVAYQNRIVGKWVFRDGNISKTPIDATTIPVNIESREFIDATGDGAWEEFSASTKTDLMLVEQYEIVSVSDHELVLQLAGDSAGDSRETWMRNQ